MMIVQAAKKTVQDATRLFARNDPMAKLLKWHRYTASSASHARGDSDSGIAARAFGLPLKIPFQTAGSLSTSDRIDPPAWLRRQRC
jgi:hypothetical protein